MQAQLLDRDRPLWELWFVEGLEDGHVGLIQKTHHALVDGVSGVDVATVLLDFTPEPTSVEPPTWDAGARAEPAQLLVDSLVRARRPSRPRSCARVRRAVAGPAARGRAQASGWRARWRRSSTASSIAPRTSLNARTGRHRRFESVRIPLDDVKPVRTALGGTVNDVVLAGVAGGFAPAVRVAGDELTDGLQLQGDVPGVGARRRASTLQLGNKVSAMFVPLPVGEPDPPERLRRDPEHDRRPEGARAGGRRRLPLRPDRLRRADADGPRRAGRAPPAVRSTSSSPTCPGPQSPLY